MDKQLDGFNIGIFEAKCLVQRKLALAILEYLAGGDSIDAVLAEFPDLERDDILACIAYDTRCQACADC